MSYSLSAIETFDDFPSRVAGGISAEAGRMGSGLDAIRDGGVGPNGREGDRVPSFAAFEDFEAPFTDDFLAVHGSTMGDRTIVLRRTGRVGGPAVLVLGGISAGRAVAESDAAAGWWPEMVGPGRPIDTRRFEVWSAEYFPLTPAGLAVLSPRDFARQYVKALRRLGVARLDALVGASFGGMVGLALAASYPGFVDRLCVLCAAGRPSPMGRALRRTQRRILELGIATGEGAQATAIARELAIATYRTAAEFNARFTDGFSLDGYLSRHGARYAAYVDPRRYHALSAAIDRHVVNGVEIRTPTRLVAVAEDQLVPLGDVERFADEIGPAARLDVISSVYGHDGFLKETWAVGEILEAFFPDNDRSSAARQRTCKETRS